MTHTEAGAQTAFNNKRATVPTCSEAQKSANYFPALKGGQFHNLNNC